MADASKTDPKPLEVVVYWVIWHGLAAIVLVFAPFLLTGTDISSISRDDASFMLILCALFLTAAAVSGLVILRRQRSGGVPAALLVIAVLGPSVVAVLLSAKLASTPLYAAAVLIMAGLLAIPLAISRHWKIAVAALAAISAATLTATDLTALFDRAGNGPAQDLSIKTHFFDLRADRFPSPFPKSGRGGAIASIDEAFIVANRTGQIFQFGWTDMADAPQIMPTSLQVPINVEAFEADIPPTVDHLKFRVADIHVWKTADRTELLASHHYWDEDRDCFTVRISATDVDTSLAAGLGSTNQWRTVFETEPCMPLKTRAHPFGGQQAGGRMVQYDDNTILVTIGDHEFDGEGSDTDSVVPQDATYSYGKTLLVDLRNGDVDIYSVGHRNPQGLYIDADRNIWLTEHGPQGGDELNLIDQGGNYGWPHVTYGTDYGGRTWPQNEAQGRHSGFDPPVYAWLPSIGISNLVRIEGDAIPLWKGDLLIASLREKKLFRTRIVEGRVVFTEAIDVGTRVRDLSLGPAGRIVLWTDRSNLLVLQPILDERLASAFTLYCAGCHAIGDGESHRIGPDLQGVFDRKSASARDFEYSTALRSSGIRWTAQKLGEFLANPQSVVPGTTMSFPGIPDPEVRAELIEHLKKKSR